MTIQKAPRVMWLLNHTTARKFEIAMLKQVGIEEIFLPKKYPDNIGFRSASVDYSEDIHLTIPPEDLFVLNLEDWYGTPSSEAWQIANRYFDILFFILYCPSILTSIVHNFNGIVLWRVFGQIEKDRSYSKLLKIYSINIVGNKLIDELHAMHNRFYFTSAFEHLHHVEESFLRSRDLFLPIGLNNCQINSGWSGLDKKIFFVCPGIGIPGYYQTIYNQFITDFKGFHYIVAGDQAISVVDPNVIGFVDKEVHERNMREMRVMFYHSTEPNHIHYHPFEAIKAGMPLVFMGGGMLDRMGGKILPGRCRTIKEARNKIKRILNDDWTLIEDIRKTQVCLLETMKPEKCLQVWQVGFDRIFKSINNAKTTRKEVINSTKRIAVILPAEYKGGTLRGAKILAQAIDEGARQAGENVEVIFCHLEGYYEDEDFHDLPSAIKRRPYTWKTLNRTEANRAMIYAGAGCTLRDDHYAVLDDKINQLMDCDLYVLVSDRLSIPLLPVKPYIVMVYDYLQRYETFMSIELNQQLMNIVHAAERVFVTTEFTKNDALQFSGLPNRKVIKLPFLVDTSVLTKISSENIKDFQYFVWTTNLSVHKNHENAIKALAIYYEKYTGQLECHITGVDTESLKTSQLPHLKLLSEILPKNKKLKRNLKFFGNLSDASYYSKLSSSTFLWHPARMDNGTFCVVEAARSGVPALSSDYPPMREINEQFNLHLNWMNAYDPENMAMQLKKMEIEASALRLKVPSAESLASQSVEKLSSTYWEAIKECL